MSLTLTWSALHASVKDKQILQNCYGTCKSGEMLAIMGPSGAGKTTLLSLLAKRINPQMQISGTVQANNTQFDQKSFFTFGAFVYQNDLLHETLTVRETLEFSARLKLPTESQAKKRVDEVLREFQLQKCQNTKIGGILIKGISGGQKKRVCIAIQMMSKPALIILDEPTSGLDSNKAAKVLSILKKLSTFGHTIIFTIHQPSYLQYSKLDRLLLLDQGRTIYQGPATDILSYMNTLKIPIPNNNTISDFFMMEISAYKRQTEHYQTPLNHQNYTLHLAKNIEQDIQLIRSSNQVAPATDYFRASWFYSFQILLARGWKTYSRDKMKYGAMLLNAVMKFLLVGLMFKDQVPARSFIALAPFLIFQKAQSVAFINISSNIMSSMFAVSITLPQERQLYIKETDSKKYNALPYYLSKVIIEFLSVGVGTSLYVISGYWLNGWTNDAEHFLHFLMICLLMSLVGNSIGFFCATLFKSVDRVSGLTPIIMIPLLCFSGMFNKLNSMPNWASWLQYASPFRYGMHLVLLNEYKQETFNGSYNYKHDLGINMTYQQNIWCMLGIGAFYYIGAFVFLKIMTNRLAN